MIDPIVDVRQLMDLGDRFTHAPRCEVCGAPTRERKPWCPAHVMTHSPLARDLHQRVLARERVDADPKAPLPADLLSDARLALRQRGHLSTPMLARVLDVSHATAGRIVEALEREGARIGSTRRGFQTVSVA